MRLGRASRGAILRGPALTEDFQKGKRREKSLHGHLIPDDRVMFLAHCVKSEGYGRGFGVVAFQVLEPGSKGVFCLGGDSDWIPHDGAMGFSKHGMAVLSIFRGAFGAIVMNTLAIEELFWLPSCTK